jgi:hypothetical protein
MFNYTNRFLLRRSFGDAADDTNPSLLDNGDDDL